MRPFLPVLPQPAPVLSAVVVKVTVDRPDVDDVHEAQNQFHDSQPPFAQQRVCAVHC